MTEAAPEDHLALLDSIRQRIDANPEALLANTESLQEGDFALLGKLIQTYCFADLNARRIVDALRHAMIGPEARYASRLQDAQVFPKLKEIVAELPTWNIKEGLLKAADTVELHRIHRHNFAHWAARRVKGHNVLIIFTKNAKESERRDGQAQSLDELKYGLVPLAPLSDELKKLEGHGEYLATTAAHIDTNFNAYKEFFDTNRRS
ncbi:hypothetical protein [Limobrevibacterium gyesilva]|uniref:Uncharacterized protein n=1 Tax=Limobrevibacterium gyesilva TaxID=2991712 RepID=A0AA42CIU9_9PROT|nr:hypothetical protein [Limobrevibacterium gyesilva]MCW3476297.1 hypothetical protein [Limobrevibacterium gyesilva]